MSETTTVNILRLSEDTKDFLKVLNFPEIPEGANYVAFYENGEAQFFETFNPGAFGLPKMQFVMFYQNVPITIED